MGGFMFKVLIIACTILPYPRGEILNTKCYSVTDQWQPSIHGYSTKKECLKRVDTITKSIKNNFKLLYLQKHHCEKNKTLSPL